MASSVKISNNTVVYLPSKKSQKIVNDYVCNKCGRRKTFRSEYPGPVVLGKCPRCKEGNMVSDIKMLFDAMAEMEEKSENTEETKDRQAS